MIGVAPRRVSYRLAIFHSHQLRPSWASPRQIRARVSAAILASCLLVPFRPGTGICGRSGLEWASLVGSRRLNSWSNDLMQSDGAPFSLRPIQMANGKLSQSFFFRVSWEEIALQSLWSDTKLRDPIMHPWNVLQTGCVCLVYSTPYKLHSLSATRGDPRIE